MSRFEFLETEEETETEEEVVSEYVHKETYSFPHLKFAGSSSWREQASCAKLPKNMFFFEVVKGRPKAYKALYQRAVSICRDCPVRLSCYEFAVKNCEAAGIWAGTTAKQRKALYKKYLVTGTLESPPAI